MNGKIDSWAIRWCFAQFRNSSFCVYPKNSMVTNLGFNDGKGVHNHGNGEKWSSSLSYRPLIISAVDESSEILHCFKKFYDISMYTSIGYFMKKYGGYRFAKKIIAIFSGG